ncbi:hypothetical protein [Crateriforma conspicua]|uniref:Uncharacterized protein n=1 Tax=Crateriforma conspicua TaxID=2527996 RepID=A0A5C5Y1H7_9PLAN|nr:hypothetical protein [Crateriforma conspicua]TWT69447.1 hypothetical protein Pan14r_17330 [Crateriforma conspicua]
MNDDNKQFLVRHADALRTLHDIPNDGKFTDAQLVELTTHPKRAIRIAGKEGCDCSNLTKLVEAIESRDFAALGELIEPARLEVYEMIDDTSPVTKTTNGAPIDLDFARRAAAKSQAKRDEEAKHFKNGQQFQGALDRYNIAWNAWSGTWENIALSRAGMLAGEAGKEDLAAALNGLVEVIRDRGFIDNLPIAVERFDPSYCDGTDDEEEAEAVKILLGLLNAVASGTDAGEVADALLAIEPLPLLFRAGSARRLLRIVDQWPNHCAHCGRIQRPKSFDSNRCPDCLSTEGTLFALFNHIHRVESDPSKEESSADRLFPFWCGWRMQLQTAFPGADGDLAIMRKWIEYLTNTKGMQRLAWQFIKFGDAANMIPQPATINAAEGEPEPDAPSVESASVGQKTKKVKPEKVSEIPADKLAQYLRAGRLHLKWIEAKKPSGEKLQWFLDESGSMLDVPDWEKLRSTSRRTANRFGFKVDATKQWVEALKKEVQQRRKAGIFVPGTENWE